MALTVTYHLVLCSDGQRVVLGDKQIAWALEEGLLELRSSSQVSDTATVAAYHTEHGAWELHEAISANLALRECDVCGRHGPWEYPLREFEPAALLKNTVMGGPKRPLYCCFMCAQWVQGRRRRELREAFYLRAAKSYAQMQGLEVQKVVGLSPEARERLRPELDTLIGQIFEHSHGRPKRRRK